MSFACAQSPCLAGHFGPESLAVEHARRGLEPDGAVDFNGLDARDGAPIQVVVNGTHADTNLDTVDGDQRITNDSRDVAKFIGDKVCRRLLVTPAPVGVLDLLEPL